MVKIVAPILANEELLELMIFKDVEVHVTYGLVHILHLCACGCIFCGF